MLRFWWKCAKIAAKDSASFANDWQWLLGIPILAAIANGAVQADGTMTLIPQHPVLNGVLVAAIVFAITWTVGFFVRLARVPAELHAEQAAQIANLTAKLSDRASLTVRFDAVTDVIRRHGGNTFGHIVVYNAGSAVAQNTVLRLIATRPHATFNSQPAILPLTVKWPDDMARWINPRTEQQIRLFGLGENFDERGKFWVVNNPGYDVSGNNVWLRLPFDRFELDYRVELANGDPITFTVVGQLEDGERVTLSRKS